MHEFTLKNIPISFPYVPYDVQITMIESAITAIIEKKNALLESPTGTGKTLCLLVASLAWLNFYEEESGCKNIIYASRTHSQLTQVVKELKKTAYKPKISILGSREQLCINQSLENLNWKKSSKTVTVMSNAVKTAFCKQLTQKRQCQYYNNTVKKGDGNGDIKSDSLVSENNLFSSLVMDIEEMVDFGHRHMCCPYYLSRESAFNAQLILTPYNYLLDSKIRNSGNNSSSSLDLIVVGSNSEKPETTPHSLFDIRNSIIIFDEGHNLESFASEVMSFEVSTWELRSSIRHLSKLINNYSNLVSPSSSAATAKTTLSRLTLKEFMESSSNGAAKNGKTKSKSDLVDLENRLRRLESKNSFPGIFIMELMQEACGITLSNAKQTLESFNDALELSSTFLSQFSAAESNVTVAQAHNSMTVIFNAFQVIFKEEYFSRPHLMQSYSSYHRVHFTKKENPDGSTDVINGTLNYWCFNASLALRALVNGTDAARCVIVASGTLSPISSMEMELGIPFEIKLENPHIISASQVFVSVVGHGPNGVTLNSSYTNRNSKNYIQDLGLSILNTIQSVGAAGGVLVFFPSYSLMESNIAHWKNSVFSGVGVWNTLVAYLGNKQPFVEPREKALLPHVLKEYSTLVKMNSTAVLFAVCRGKVSEGLDFSDSMARAVIVTGLPYPPANDPKIVLKKSIIQQQHSGKADAIWYTQQALRAINQAIGRVIRHKNDWGCIVLLDERFSYSTNIEGLSLWIRPMVKVFTTSRGYGEYLGEIKSFMKNYKYQETPQIMELKPSSSILKMNFTQSLAERKLDIEKQLFENDPSMENKKNNDNKSGLFLQNLISIPAAVSRFSQYVHTSSGIDLDNKTNTKVQETVKNPFLSRNQLRILSASSMKPSFIKGKSSTELVATESSNPSNDQKEKSKEFLDAMKNLIPSAPYMEFAGYLKSLHRKTMSLSELFIKITELFSNHNLIPNDRAVHLLKNMRFFISEHSRSNFDNVTEQVMINRGMKSAEQQLKKIKTDYNNPCPICFIDEMVDPHKSKGCNHECCLECWKSWLAVRLECPICRQRVRVKQLIKK